MNSYLAALGDTEPLLPDGLSSFRPCRSRPAKPSIQPIDLLI